MIKREHYIEQIRPFYESDLIKIITGIRRCGKSVIMEQIIKEISEKTDNVIYLNFEDKKVSANVTNADELIAYAEEHKKDGKCYLFRRNSNPRRLAGRVQNVKIIRLFSVYHRL
mgnify:CR=1 FL=1